MLKASSSTPTVDTGDSKQAVQEPMTSDTDEPQAQDDADNEQLSFEEEWVKDLYKHWRYGRS